MKRDDHKYEVFILESEGAFDLVHKRSEGEGLERLLPLMDYKCVLRKADCRDSFLNYLEVYSRSECDILHISCHGNEKGLGLTNGDFITWVELYAALKKTHVPFMLNLSSCEATGQDELIKLFKASDDRPFMVAGSSDSLTWDEAFIAWGLIYRAHTACKEESYGTMCDAMAALQLALGRRFRATWFRDNEGKSDETDCFDSVKLLETFQRYHVEIGKKNKESKSDYISSNRLEIVDSSAVEVKPDAAAEESGLEN